MSDDLQAIEEWAGALLLKLAPAQRRAVNKQVAQDLRRSQVKRIVSQQTPDGEAYTARKQRKNLRGKSGRIKRQKAAMFAKIRKQKSLTIQQDENQLSVGFFGRVARIARVHQEGLTDKVSKKGPEVRYAARPLLGFSAEDHALIRDSVLRQLINI
ncbi:phage virion morphogenesis protein [Glaciimonas sp. CA11.2]|uniref:phage virion morphogenesis protein n=1 Tax=Glaciimonas sp. CA11.2 TaxID=3048601 RepID=UPI002AB51CD3|nr:phage virion morphogenesis protein [Glaciimonas sp. CA11.2]MDY7546713.1 phage virion morphogenesis protein [Glaciimonas sp. CA11.2]MEB0164205.1 phage virion morphogenesis protein [Glaciimonas sp. CA11.2]